MVLLFEFHLLVPADHGFDLQLFGELYLQVMVAALRNVYLAVEVIYVIPV